MAEQILHRRNFLLHLQERSGYEGPVLLKEPAHAQLTTAQIAQLHNEYEISQKFAHLPGVRPVHALEGSESHPVLVLKYIEGNSLAEIAQRHSLDLPQKLQLAVKIADMVGQIHDAGLMHRDISSSNILVNNEKVVGDNGGVTIIDFGLATRIRRELISQPIEIESLAGSLAYLSPEQTGRMRRRVDHRSDLYSLGVTLYELLAGRLPFETDDPLEMIHSHMAQNPRPISEIDTDIPQTLSDIILKLLAKNADNRYQSAKGLTTDLANCLKQLQETGRIEPFEIGVGDFISRLHIPARLYGRETEIAQLEAIFDRVAQGNTELLLVAGYSGVGKTALVHAIRRNVLSKGGLFIEGKFDQLKRASPYTGWAQAFTQLANQWLAGSETDLVQWRETILDAVGNHGQILIDIIPVLERVLGPQPELPQLGSVESQNRLNYTFNRFINSLVTAGHPLVIFLDDMQWIDPASLNFVETLMTSQGIFNLMIIGAYRDNEVSPEHPLTASQNRIHDATERLTVMKLSDLEIDEVSHLLADTLQLTIAECHNLSQILVEKTAGNPFYFRQLLYALESDEELRFDRQKQRWIWADHLQQSLQARGSVVDLMVSMIQALPVKTQRSLSMAACIGSRFETSTMGIIIGQPPADILADLKPALRSGLIDRLDDQYMFSHDRIHEAAYALIPKSDLPKKHLEIGRLLLEAIPKENLDKEIFNIVSHLNAGRTLIDKSSERTELAAFNLKAGQKAKTTSAYADAKEFIEIGLDLLDPDSWQKQYELTLRLHNENGELACLTGRFDQLDPTLDLIRRHAKSIYDQVHSYMIQIEAVTAQYNVTEALSIGLPILEKLGFDIPSEPTADDSQRLHEQFSKLLKSEPAERLAQMTAMSDKKAQAASSLLASVMSTAYIANPPLFPIISYNGAILTLEYGLDVWSPFFFGGVALVNIASMTQEVSVDESRNLIRFNKQLVGIIRQMLKNPVTAGSRSKGLMMLAFTVPWFEPIEQGVEISQATYNSGYETGDWLYGSYGAIHFAIQGIAAGVKLSLYRSQLSDYVHSLNRVGQKTTPQWLLIYLQTAQNFMEISTEPDQLNGTFFKENDWLPDATSVNDISGRHFFYVDKLMLAYHFDVDDRLDEYASLAEEFISGALSLFSVPLFYFLFALGKLRLAGASDPENQEESMNLVDNSLRLMEIWSRSAPSTFQHKYDLITAEKARVTDDTDGALDHYEKAINGARDNGFIHEEALANELYARFWLEKGKEHFANQFMREAHSLYRKWGALAKAEHLARRYPDLLVTRSIIADELRVGVIFDQMAGDLDLQTILKASQAIAGEIELEPLLDLLMTFIIENSGAQLGYLILEQEGQWLNLVQAGGDGVEPHAVAMESVVESGMLPTTIVNYVARTQQTVILDKAYQNGQFVDDPYIRRREVLSLLCTPLVNQGKTSAILYLENNLSPGVFTRDRVELLSLLSSQMAISIDNARTHSSLEHLLEERSRALVSAEEQIRTLFENSPLGIALSSFDGRFLSVNEALVMMLRASREELLESNVTDFYLEPSDRSALLTKVQEFGSVQNFGVRLIRSDGSDFFASFNLSRLVLEDEEVLLAIIEDVTDEITAEQEAATLEERERLARELHDAVTQTLFSAGVLAQALPLMLKKDPVIAQQNFERLSILINGALAEMRTLILEQRPSELKEQDIFQLLGLLVESMRARTRAKISLDVEESCSPSEELAICLYRIAQEALNNVVRHAVASEVIVELSCDDEDIKLSVRDDGQGFDQRESRAGHFGISIMQERAESVGAKMEIVSRIGEGTEVIVSWPAPGEQNDHE